jgi:hypothetical protein
MSQITDASRFSGTPNADLLETATADFRANLRHARTHSLLVGYYLKRGLSADQIRQAIRNASTSPVRTIRVDLPSQAAA